MATLLFQNAGITPGVLVRMTRRKAATYEQMIEKMAVISRLVSAGILQQASPALDGTPRFRFLEYNRGLLKLMIYRDWIPESGDPPDSDVFFQGEQEQGNLLPVFDIGGFD
jgi:hypothetical protein